MAEFVPVDHDPFVTDVGTTLANAANEMSGVSDREPPIFTASDSLSRFYDVWKRGSDKYAGMVDNPLDISRLGDTWQNTPGLSAASGFGPGNMGVMGSVRMPPTTRINDLVNKFRLLMYLGDLDNPTNQNLPEFAPKLDTPQKIGASKGIRLVPVDHDPFRNEK